MKKFALVFSIILYSCHLFAQSDFSFFGGPQITSSNYKVGTAIQNTENKLGFHIGVAKKISFDNQLFFYPSVSYSLKGYKVSLQNPSILPGVDVVHDNTTFHTLDISPLFQIDFNNKPGHLFFRFGPSFDVAFAGKEELTLKNGNIEKRDMKFGFGDYGFVGASLVSQFGYEKSQSFYISTRYDHGVGNISNTDGGPKILHRVLSLSLGVYLSKK